jgi:hypothetical protein
VKNDTTHPAFIIGGISYLLLLIGVVVKGNDMQWGYYLIISAFILGAIHWVWSIIDVFSNQELKGTRSRLMWMIVVIILAPLGGMLYYAMRRKTVRF